MTLYRCLVFSAELIGCLPDKINIFSVSGLRLMILSRCLGGIGKGSSQLYDCAMFHSFDVV